MLQSRSTGSNYTRTLYFDPRADEPIADGYWMTDDELSEKLSILIGTDEKIQNASVYSNPLSSLQLTNGKLYHAFVIIQTMNWWWSIEKNTEGITIQRSKDIESVRDMYQREKRTTGPSPWTWIRKIKTTQGKNITIKELVNYFWRKDVLNKGYHVLSANCQEFAAMVFDRIKSFDKQVYFDEAADQPPSSTSGFYMTVDKAFDEVRRCGGLEPLTERLESYKLRIPFKRYVWNAYLMISCFHFSIFYISLSFLLILTFVSLTLNFNFKDDLILFFVYFFALLIIFIIFPVLNIILYFYCSWRNKEKNHIVMIFKTKEGTYWSLEQLKTRLVIHRAKNKDVLLNECQRHPRCTSLKDSKMVVRVLWNDMNEVMEYFCKNQKNKNEVFQSVIDIDVISSFYYYKSERKPRRETVDV